MHTHITTKDIIALRRRLRLSLTRMAQRLGVSRGTYCNWEYGHRKPSAAGRMLLEKLRQEMEAGGV